MKENKGIALSKLIIIILVLIVIVVVGGVIFLKIKRSTDLKKLEIEKNEEITEFLKNNEKESIIEYSITIAQENFQTTKANQKLSGKNLMNKEINKMWYEHESPYVEEVEIITYNNEEWEIENFKLIPGENKITIFAQAGNEEYKSKTIKIYYDSGKGYEIDPFNIKYDKKEQTYYNNVVMIDFEEDVSEERRKEIVASIGGKVVGRINILDQFQVEVSPRNLSKMRELCDKLKKLAEVEMAYLDSFSVME